MARNRIWVLFAMPSAALLYENLGQRSTYDSPVRGAYAGASEYIFVFFFFVLENQAFTGGELNVYAWRKAQRWRESTVLRMVIGLMGRSVDRKIGSHGDEGIDNDFQVLVLILGWYELGSHCRRYWTFFFFFLFFFFFFVWGFQILNRIRARIGKCPTSWHRPYGICGVHMSTYTGAQENFSTDYLWSLIEVLWEGGGRGRWGGRKFRHHLGLEFFDCCMQHY